MKSMKSLLFGLLALLVASAAFAQPGVVAFYYICDGAIPPLPQVGPCTAAAPFIDGTLICIYWDNDNNGPDNDDPILEEGELEGEVLPSPCLPFNSAALGCTSDGYFASEANSVFTILPANPTYFLKINANGMCLTSTVFTVSSGPQDIMLDAADWTCVQQPCPTTGSAPNPPRNVVASDDDECANVLVEWDAPDGGAAWLGYNIYADGEFATQVGPAVTEQLVQRWTMDARATYTVKAYNGVGESVASNSDQGGTILMRFNQAVRDTLVGSGWGGETARIGFVTAVPPTECPAFCRLSLLYKQGPPYTGPWLNHGLVFMDSLTNLAIFTIPAANYDYCVLVLNDTSTTNSSIYSSDTTSVFSLGVSADDHTITPHDFSLSQNYPNPFNPTTQIDFTVPFTSDVTIQVFNVMGQVVRTLADSRYSGGLHTITWDGLSDAGSTVGAGLYFYRMTAGDFVQTQKMLLMK